MELSNRMRRFLSVLVVIGVIVGIMGLAFFIKQSVFDRLDSFDVCANSTDSDCVDKFNTSQTHAPPTGNPSQLQLIKVTDNNNNIIKPPTGQDALIAPTIKSNETNQTNP